MKFKIVKDDGIGQQFTIHPSHLNNLGITHKKQCLIRFGLEICTIEITPSSIARENEIIMSEETIQKLKLPLFSEFELIYKDKQLHLGPYIGIVAGKNLSQLNERVSKLARYVRSYEKFGGVLIAFSPDGINKENRIISGFVYNPSKKTWEKGELGYPSAIFKKTSLSSAWKEHFNSLLGDKVFNSSTFDKWEMYKWLDEFTELKDHLPETNLYQNFEDVIEILRKHKSIYVKPINGMQGKRIVRVEQKEDGIIVQPIANGSKKEYYFKDIEEAKELFDNLLQKNKYIVQQSLNLELIKNSIIDFRVILVKDQSAEWKIYGIVSRSAVTSNIVSNRHRGGKVEMADKTLSTIFKAEGKKDEILEKISTLALKSAYAIEECGMHFGKLGIDIGFDVTDHVWLIEINHRNPNDFVASFAGNKQIVNQIRLANMLYAKKLAGFDEYI